jgi:hypothetical protein
MTNNPGNPFAALLNALKSIFKPGKPPTPGGAEIPQPGPGLPADNTSEPVRIITSRVMLVIYDPIMDPITGIKLSQKMGWNRVEALVNEFIADILALSTGMARYQVVQRVELNEFPALTDGYRYNPSAYTAVENRTAAPHKPDMVNYQAILTSLNILPRIATREIDEVWIFNFPYAGFYESIMGGEGAFWCNANPLTGTAGSSRKFIIMGFNYERGVGEMLEAFGHRAESLVAKAFNCQEFVDWTYQPNRTPATVGATLNLFQKFLCFDQIAPGKSGVGNIHYAPNSLHGYEWNNPRRVMSNCHDWYNFPHFQNDIREVGPEEWGGGDMRSHHEWWLKHLPRVAGRTEGVANNWWQYIMDPNLVNL